MVPRARNRGMGDDFIVIPRFLSVSVLRHLADVSNCPANA